MTNNTHPPTPSKPGRNREERKLPGTFMPVPSDLLVNPAYTAASTVEIGAWYLLSHWADVMHKETFDASTAYSLARVTPENGPALFVSMAARGFVELSRNGAKVRVNPPERYLWGDWRAERAKAKAENPHACEGAPRKPCAPTQETVRTQDTQTHTGAPGRSPLGAHHTELQTPAPAPAPKPASKESSGVFNRAFCDALDSGATQEVAVRLAQTAEQAHRDQAPGFVLPFPTPIAKPQESD